MIPSSLGGVLAFLASVGPGYLYVRVAERWRPYVQRTALREAAQIVVTGSLATLIGVVVVLIVGNAAEFLDVEHLYEHPGHYLVTQPNKAGLALVMLLFVSYGLAFVVARFSPGKGAEVFPDSGWYAAFERRLPPNNAIVATVELVDGRKVTGVVQSFTAEPGPVDDRELTLVRSTTDSMKVVFGDGEERELEDNMLLLRGSSIVYISASFVPVAVEPNGPSLKDLWLAWARSRPKVFGKSDSG